MAYQVAFFTAEGSFILPINPPKFPVKNGADHTTVNILGGGEAVHPGQRKLRSYELESFFPAAEASAGVAFFLNHLDSKLPLRMIFTRGDREPDNVAVVIMNFDYEERGGYAPGEIDYKLTLREFRPIQAKVI
ncbi:MAG: hypothetical protein FWE76_01900 [Symbiobacteriaceae bacterium]|nr:hypothetical protein [Symbiobacteriaceae bacterium]